MFDLRYHVASLVAVFLALIIGILVGVGISGKGFVSDSERSLLNERIADLKNRLDSATTRSNDLARAQRAAQTFVADVYPAVMDGRMLGSRVGLVFAGPTDGRVRSLVEQSLADASGDAPVRMRALKLPIDLPSLRRALARAACACGAGDGAADRRPRQATRARLRGRRRQPGVEGRSSPQLVEEQSGNDAPPLDGVVVSRSVPAQSGVTARFLAGFYSGLASAGIPAVGAERLRAKDSAIDAFSRENLSTVDDLDTEAGRLALVLLLSGASPGSYGVKKTADDGVLPAIPTAAGG